MLDTDINDEKYDDSHNDHQDHDLDNRNDNDDGFQINSEDSDEDSYVSGTRPGAAARTNL